MANNKVDVQATDPVEQAMNRVLQAERDADRAIDACEREAQQILQAAHHRARRITDRTDERSTLLHMRCNHRVSDRIKALERAHREEQSEPCECLLDPETLADVVEDVAALLTGEEGNPAPGKQDPE